MTNHDDEPGQTSPPERFPPPPGTPKAQMDSANERVAGTGFDQLRTKASDTASAIYREGRELLTSSEERARAKDQVSESIRKNPLAAVGVAFTAGVLLALLMRG